MVRYPLKRYYNYPDKYFFTRSIFFSSEVKKAHLMFKLY